jgi:lipoprotein-anchoring transpeptidase ErfK/SrfK
VTRDYYSVLKRATSALDPNTERARRAVYDRARHAIIDADLPSAEIKDEQSALEAAIERIEAETQQAAPASTPRSEGEASPTATGQPPDGHERMLVRSKRFSRAMIAAAGMAALLLIGFVGYAFWPSGPVKTTAVPTAADPRAPSVDDPQSASGPTASTRPYTLNRQMVYYRTIHPVGTVIIVKSQGFLYLVRPNIAAVRYTLGVGRECANAAGLLLVSGKEQWREGAAQPIVNEPRQVANAAESARAGSRYGPVSLALGDTGHRIHGTGTPAAPAEAGCFRLVNEDIDDLYDRVSVGARVVIN